MSIITIMENNLLKEYRKNCKQLLSIEKNLVEYFFSWVKINHENNMLTGNGILNVNNEIFEIRLKYSPFFEHRFDRITIVNKNIKYNRAIHVYGDMCLCLYHPIIDKPLFKIIPLVNMIPWITEWCINYIQWEKYKIWLGKEIKH